MKHLTLFSLKDETIKIKVSSAAILLGSLSVKFLTTISYILYNSAPSGSGNASNNIYFFDSIKRAIRNHIFGHILLLNESDESHLECHSKVT